MTKLKKVNIFIDKKFRDTAPPKMIDHATTCAGELFHEIVQASAGMDLRSFPSSEALNVFSEGGLSNCLNPRFVKACKAASWLEILITYVPDQMHSYRINVTLRLPKGKYTVRLRCYLSDVDIKLLCPPDYAHPY